MTKESENRIVICKAGEETKYAGDIINLIFGLVTGKKVKPTMR